MEKISTVYIVAPTEQLTSLTFPTAELHDFAIAERAWLNSEGGVSDFTNDDHVSIVKIAVLAYFLSFNDLDQILESPRLSIQTFDRFWTIRRFNPEGKLSHIGDYAQRVNETRYESLGNTHADQVAKRLIGWSNNNSAS